MKRWPAPDYPFTWRKTPPSGNRLNGLGETVFRRARQIFHGSGARALEWAALERYFAMTVPWRVYWLNLVNRWMLRKADGAVATRRVPASSPEAGADAIKARALALGAGAVGIAHITEAALFEGYETPFTHAVVVLTPMDPAETADVPGPRSGIETMRAYREAGRTVIALAEHIRSLGWPARAYGEGADILYIPLAIAAGLGQLGKHGSLISRELGSNLRISAVLTTLPLPVDTPVEVGVDDLCAGCRRCTIDCPPGAILDTKQIVRGAEKWYVDFDRCVPYFTLTVGCGICIEVCPWSTPGRGPSLSMKLLAKRAERSGR